MSVDVLRFDPPAAEDALALAAALAALARRGPIGKAALLMKVLGDYGDGSRERAHAAAGRAMAVHRLENRSEYVTVVGCDGATTPAGYLLAEIDDRSTSAPPRLALGLAHGPAPADGELDRAALAEAAAEVTRAAMADAALDPRQVAQVLINVPQPRLGDAWIRGRRARAAAALGAGVALGEVDAARINDAALASEVALFARRAQSFTGPTVRQIEAIVLGNRPGAGGELVACSAFSASMLDARPFKRALVAAGLRLDADGEIAEPERVLAAIVKSGPSADGRIGGEETIIFKGGLPPEKHVRAAQSGVFGTLLRSVYVLNTFDPVQQVPAGGGSVGCFVVRVPPGHPGA